MKKTRLTEANTITLERQAPERGVVRVSGGGRLKPLEDAPGTYVTVKA